MKRRKLFAAAAIPFLAPATAAAAPFAITEWKRPEDFGAMGDGVADDGPALVQLSDWLSAGPGRGAQLRGRYRAGRRQTPQLPGGWGFEGAITLQQPNHVALVFEDGAQLLLDNLDAQGAGDQYHGIVVRGGGGYIWFAQPNVAWVSKPTARSQGDGMRFQGYPSDTARGSAGDAKLQYITIDNSQVKWAPQTGMIFLGCSDVTVTNHIATETLADACHFNACRRVSAARIQSDGSGDDTCAFVTYHDDNNVEGQIPGLSPYSQPGLGQWNNSASSVGDVVCRTSPASGLRLAGALDVRVNSVTAGNALQAAIVDAAVAGGNIGWTYFQSRQCGIGTVSASACALGFAATSENNAYASNSTKQTAGIRDPRYSQMDVTVSTLIATGCTSWGLYVQDIEGLTITQAETTGRGFSIVHVNNASFGSLAVRDASSPSEINNCGALKPVTIGNLYAENTQVTVQNEPMLEIKQYAGAIIFD